jgi:hypothetical protein
LDLSQYWTDQGLCQINGYFIITESSGYVARPNATTKNLQPTHNALWIAKQQGNYRFTIGLANSAIMPTTFSERGKQLRDVWDIPCAPHENKRYGHPSPNRLRSMSVC